MRVPADRYTRAARARLPGLGAGRGPRRTMAGGPAAGPLAPLVERASPSWLRQLSEDPEAGQHAPNRASREVRAGHYVRLRPTPLPDPRLVAHSPAVARALGLSDEAVASAAFAAFFSGDQDRAAPLEAWATPYALSIMGRRYTNNCPFGTGNGYGDGRALSVAEVETAAGERWELQLKGGGATPFCRGGDGRAVLRSSVREFLASEAMHALHVPTTRALSLVVSGSETAKRPWYSGRGGGPPPTVDDPRLAQFPAGLRQALLAQLSQQGREPDVMVEEPCAITTRVAPSFLRVGQLDLFARRAEAGRAGALGELEALVEHALFREFPGVRPGAPLPERAAGLLEAAADKIAAMVAEWMRVGYAQGNFNADNCLVGGRTMDYGPFGFMERYDAQFAKWTGSGEHFAFMAQPAAGLANYATLATALAPLLAGGAEEAQATMAHAVQASEAAVADVWRRKLGFPASAAGRQAAEILWPVLHGLLEATPPDWTVLWRQLAEVAELPAGADDAALLAPLREAFYEWPLEATSERKWVLLLKRWLKALDEVEPPSPGAQGGPRAAVVRLRRENPKYVPREWMLAEAYEAAGAGDFSAVHELQALFGDPYGEGSAEQARKYFRRAPDWALQKGGVAVMT